MREQRVRALIARQSIQVSLHGLSCERAATVSDILTPKIRRSPFNGEGMYTTFLSQLFAISLQCNVIDFEHSYL